MGSPLSYHPNVCFLFCVCICTIVIFCFNTILFYVFFIFRFLISCVFVVFLPRMTQVFCSLGMKDMMFQHRQKSNPMLWRVRNAEFVERGNWRFGRDGLGVIEKIVIKSYYPKCSLLNYFFFIRTRA